MRLSQARLQPAPAHSVPEDMVHSVNMLFHCVALCLQNFVSLPHPLAAVGSLIAKNLVPSMRCRNLVCATYMVRRDIGSHAEDSSMQSCLRSVGNLSKRAGHRPVGHINVETVSKARVASRVASTDWSPTQEQTVHT